jgi:Bacterial Ig-like domain
LLRSLLNLGARAEQAEKPMKIYPVARWSRLAVLVSLSACSGNGTLFDESEESADNPAGKPSADDSAASVAQAASPDAAMSRAPAAPVSGGSAVTEAGAEGGLPFVGSVPGHVEAGPPPPTVSEPPAVAERPAILSVSPKNGAVGVASDANIVIVFSEPMDHAVTEAAYQSESLPSGSVSFLWNDDSTELTVVPDAPLAYPTGSDPAEVEARRVSFFVSSSAADAEGRRLAEPYESSFSLLRQIELSLLAVQDRDLSGSFRSNDSYGGGACARGQINMCVGDQRVNGENEQYKGFISFELVDVPVEAQGLSAMLSMQITAMSGNPFGGLGGLVLEHASFDVIDIDAFEEDALDEIGLIADAGRAGATVSADVSAAFSADRLERALSQYRLRFEDATDGDATADTLLSAWDTQTLDVSYLLP